MSTIAFLVHPYRPEAVRLAAEASEWLTEHGHRVLVPADDGTAPGPMTGADLAVSLGGDGTMLRTVNLAWQSGVPVLGVNLGRLGYLTEVEPAGLQAALRRFLSGQYAVEERMMLEVGWATAEQNGGQTCLASNEAVVEKTVPDTPFGSKPRSPNVTSSRTQPTDCSSLRRQDPPCTTCR